MDDYQHFIHLSRYARWDADNGRRESWEETVRRYVNFWNKSLTLDEKGAYKDSIRAMEVMPSMRAMATAGPALERDNIAGYNCAYVPIDHPKAFSEVLHILMNGTGVGFSVEREYVNQLPEIPEEMVETANVIVVQDSKEGWARAYRTLINSLYYGEVPKWDLGAVRPAGARLKTFGGRASGPGPLNQLFTSTCAAFTSARGRRLTTLEVHDIICNIAAVVIVGGVRRSALISLSNLSDDRMRAAKSGYWWDSDRQRAYANNSVAYTTRPDIGSFLKEWGALYESKSGERGIFSRPAARRVAERNGRRDSNYDFGTNPCSEIILRPREFCNLSEVVVRSGDDRASLVEKIKLATILGTLQSTLTDFKFIGKKWKDNCEEERLLGVSLTGIMDNPLTAKPTVALLEELRNVAIDTNKVWAERLGIPQSAAITCVKPSGTVSQLVNAASGIHPRYSEFYIRSVRQDKKDPLSDFLISQGVPHEEEINNSGQWVFYFPIKSPKKAVTRDQVTALQQLELWKMYATHWCEHKPSITVYVKEEEWMDVGAWVYDNFEEVSGLSFLPYDGGVYAQPPYREVTKDEYEMAAKAFPKINWEEFKEQEDNTEASQEFACVGNMCEI